MILGVVMTASFVYSGLKLGFIISGSPIAAILGFAFLRGLLRRGTIVENNINQAIASAVNVSAAGIIFTVPALLLMGSDFNPLAIAVVAVAGSLLGNAVISPLRKQMIEIERLRFPSGTAVAAVLKSPGAGVRQGILLAAGCFVSAVSVVLVKMGFIPQDVPVGGIMGLPGYMNTALSLSLMNIGAGILAGRGGLPFVAGGMAAYWFAAPVAVNAGWVPQGDPQFLFSMILRPLGIGILVGSALIGVFTSLHVLRGAVTSLRRASNGIFSGDEMNLKTLAAISAVASAAIVAMLIWQGMGFFAAIGITVVALVWIIVAGLIVARCTGMTDISPISGLSLIGIAIVLFITGGDVVVSVTIGAAVSVASGQCADMMQDLKTGQMVGGVPKRLQAAQFLSAWIGPIVALGTVALLWYAGSGPGFGPESAPCRNGASDCLSAPQADALRAMIQGLLRGDLPLERYAAGGIIGALISLLPVSGLGVLLGLSMYLPFPVTLGFGAGCAVEMGISRLKGPAFVEDAVVPAAAGLIIGEATAEIIYSLYKIFS